MTTENQEEQGKQNVDSYTPVKDLEESEDAGNSQRSAKPNKANPALKKAIKNGWAPKDKWKGNPDDWVDYREFNYRGELMGHIRHANDKVSSLEQKLDVATQALDKLGKVNAQIMKKEKEDIVASLKQEKVDAINEGRGDDVLKIDDKLKEVETEFADAEEEEATDGKQKQEQQQQNFPKEFVDWAQANSQWYGKDQAMTKRSEIIGEQFVLDYVEEYNEAPSIQEVLDHVDEELRERYPEKFGIDQSTDDDEDEDLEDDEEETPKSSRRKRRKSTAIETDGNAKANQQKANRGKQGKKSQYTVKDLSHDEYPVVKQMAESSGVELQDYIDQLATMGELDVQQ